MTKGGTGNSAETLAMLIHKTTIDYLDVVYGSTLAPSLNSNPNFRTLPVGITRYQGEFTFPWPIISAALIVAIVPIAVLIAIFQERVVGGLTQGGLKG